MMSLLLFCVFSWFVATCGSIFDLFDRSPPRRVTYRTEGFLPEGDKDGMNYFERFDLDYDEDANQTVRVGGRMAGFLFPGALNKLQFRVKDPIHMWFLDRLQNGTFKSSERLKPFFVSYHLGLLSFYELLWFYRV